jgi:predicted amidophosphoribosyltransferase
MPRIQEQSICRHCKAELPHPTPRTCPECGGSLQQRYLQSGCLTSKPLLALVGLGLVAWRLVA